MLCLTVADSNATSGMGPVAAIGIVVTVVVMLTLLPALLVTVGRWVFWPVRPRYGSVEPSATGMWARAGAAIARRPRAVWLVTSLALATVALGVFRLDATGLTDKESFRATPDSVVGEAVLAAHFPVASGGQPVVVLSRADRAADVRAAVAATPGIDAASVPAPVIQGERAYLEGTLTAPVDSAAAFDTIDRVRARVHAIPGADARVGGRTATNLDLRRAAQRDQSLIIPLVLAVVLVILALLLRAIVAPPGRWRRCRPSGTGSGCSTPPTRADSGWFSTLRRPAEEVQVVTRFAGYGGRYVFHCHNLEHEDMAMMANFVTG